MQRSHRVCLAVLLNLLAMFERLVSAAATDDWLDDWVGRLVVVLGDDVVGCDKDARVQRLLFCLTEVGGRLICD